MSESGKDCAGQNQIIRFFCVYFCGFVSSCMNKFRDKKQCGLFGGRKLVEVGCQQYTLVGFKCCRYPYTDKNHWLHCDLTL